MDIDRTSTARDQGSMWTRPYLKIKSQPHGTSAFWQQLQSVLSALLAAQTPKASDMDTFIYLQSRNTDHAVTREWKYDTSTPMATDYTTAVNTQALGPTELALYHYLSTRR